MARDDLAAHARDELGITDIPAARPIQAAVASASSFAAGAALPLITTVFSRTPIVAYIMSAVSIAALAVLGALGAKLGGARVLPPTVRVAFWGALAMAVMAGVGALVGRAI